MFSCSQDGNTIHMYHAWSPFVFRMAIHQHTLRQNVAPRVFFKNCSNLTRILSPQAGLIFTHLGILGQTNVQNILCIFRNFMSTSFPLFFCLQGTQTPPFVPPIAAILIFFCRNRITDSTPLHVATEGGHTDVVKLLISCGASPLDENKVALFFYKFSNVF